MPEKSLEQTNFLPQLDKPADVVEKKPAIKPAPKRIFDAKFMEETFGEHKVPPLEDSDKPSQDESTSRPKSHSRRKFRLPYPEGYDGNPIITKDPEEQKG